MASHKQCKPYGNPATAKVFVIGHDPTLQTSPTVADYAFFIDYIMKPRPTLKAERTKHDFALGTYIYIKALCGRSISFEDMYFTNLCNRSLDHENKGMILIDKRIAGQGIQEIEATLREGSFQVILPMSQQVSYHLANCNFVKEASSDRLVTFLKKSQPKPEQAKQGVYAPVGAEAFVDVCGNTYTHRGGVPVVPILHVKQWLNGFTISPKYFEPMSRAGKNVRRVLKG
ncbi:MAG: hypothetical protein SVP26_05980 [Chloroflexota bacterium]|nr:hypothetical protein [Chloroflexota bacterium]